MQNPFNGIERPVVWVGSGGALGNPFNGIERGGSPGAPELPALRNPFNGIERCRAGVRKAGVAVVLRIHSMELKERTLPSHIIARTYY